MVSVGTLAIVAFVVARRGLLSGFLGLRLDLGLGLWFGCILGTCAKSVLVWVGVLEDDHGISIMDRYRSLSRTKEG